MYILRLAGLFDVFGSLFPRYHRALPKRSQLCKIIVREASLTLLLRSTASLNLLSKARSVPNSRRFTAAARRSSLSEYILRPCQTVKNPVRFLYSGAVQCYRTHECRGTRQTTRCFLGSSFATFYELTDRTDGHGTPSTHLP